MTGLDRREFLKLVGAGTAAAAASACQISDLGTFFESDAENPGPPPGPETFVASLCGLCPGGCGILARRIGERVVKLEGNPLHPVNRGRLCPVGQASPELLYNPDRLQSPVKRDGERNSGRWRPISWDEAIEMVRSKLAALRQQEHPHTLAVLSGGRSEIADRLMQRFVEVYGSPNFIRLEAADADPSQAATQGVNDGVAYDLENTGYVLSFGAPLVEGWMSPVRQMRSLGQLRQGRPGKRAKLVQIESRLSTTAAKADQWVPVRPGTEGILALGLAHVLIAQKLCDDSFVQRYVAGFESAAEAHGFRALVVDNYPPEVVAEMTGVPAKVIERLAREFALNRPSIALPPDAVASSERTRVAGVAVQALNALVGNIDRPGGVLVREPAPLAAWAASKPDPVAARGVQQASFANLRAESLTAAIRDGKPYAIDALVMMGANPVFSVSEDFREALAKVPFVVSFSPFLDETAQSADLVVPDCTPLERYDIQSGVPGFALNTVGVASPALAPLHQSRPAAQVILDLARAFGGDIASAFPWAGPVDAIKELVAGLYASKHGQVFAEKFKDQYLTPALRGWQWPAPDVPSFDHFWDDIVARGGWVDPRYTFEDYKRTLKTASGRFELYALLGAKPALEAARVEDKYPLYLHVFRPLALINEAGANLPFLQEIAGSPEPGAWNSWVELNPETARKFSISDNDWIMVESGAGRLKARARLFAGAMPEVVNLPLGQGHTALGRWARDRGVNPRTISGDGGSVRVRIEKV